MVSNRTDRTFIYAYTTSTWIYAFEKGQRAFCSIFTNGMFRQRLPKELVQAIKEGDLPAVQYYLDDGVSPNIRHVEDAQRKPLLSYAALHGHIHIMKLLIERGAIVDTMDRNRRTPLSWAAEFCQLEAAKLLVDYGADINSEDEELSTPLAWLIYAVQEGDTMYEMQSYLESQGAKETLRCVCE